MKFIGSLAATPTRSVSEDGWHIPRLRFGLMFAFVASLSTHVLYAVPALIPEPVSVNPLMGISVITADAKLYYEPAAAKAEAETLAQFLRPATGFKFPVAQKAADSDASNAIFLKLRPALKTSVGSEGYVLTSHNDVQITIEAAEPAGLFYGGQTFRQLLPRAIYAKTAQPEQKWDVFCCRIVDSPRFIWRGYMLDYSRHWLDLDYTKHLLDGMAMHKLNVLHMHLADDDGWRIEIKKYPKLTEVGAWRGTKCAVPNTRPGEKFERYGGFFTQDQIREVVAYAARLHISVMPEIDLPGHSLALCISYPQVRPMRTVDGKLVPEVTGDVISPAKESNYAMIDDILGELNELFPYDYMHIGGDEVNHGMWSKCPEIKEFMAKEKIADLHMAQVYFTKRLEGILAKHHKKMIGWNEILNDKLERSTGIMSWTGVGPGYQAARKGFPVVMAPAQHNYFDLQYPDAHDEPPALAWAGMVDCKRCYQFDPLGEKGLTTEQGRKILGVHGCLWSELVQPFKSKEGWLELKTPGETADYKTYPRLCALAEQGWTPQAARDFGKFSERLGEHYGRLKEAGIMFRVPPVAVVVSGTSIEIVPPFHDAHVRYTLDGSEPLTSGKDWDGKALTGDPKLFRARTIFDGRPSALCVGPEKAKGKK